MSVTVPENVIVASAVPSDPTAKVIPVVPPSVNTPFVASSVTSKIPSTAVSVVLGDERPRYAS